MDTETILRRQRQVLCDTKWQAFNKKTWLFKYIPFVDVVFGGGSLALGNVNENSDFDVLILAKSGRIFSARFFQSLLLVCLVGAEKADHRLVPKIKSV
jgi:hypothetical protein